MGGDPGADSLGAGLAPFDDRVELATIDVLDPRQADLGAPAFQFQEVVQGCAELGGDVVVHGYQ